MSGEDHCPGLGGGQGRRWKVPKGVSGGQCQELGLNSQPLGNSFLGRGSLPPPGSLFPLSRYEKKLRPPQFPVPGGGHPSPSSCGVTGSQLGISCRARPSPFLMLFQQRARESCLGEGCDTPPQS